MVTGSSVVDDPWGGPVIPGISEFSETVAGSLDVQQYQGEFIYHAGPPPTNASGQVRTDLSWPQTTVIAFSTYSQGGQDATALWRAMQIGDKIDLTQGNNTASLVLGSVFVEGPSGNWQATVSYQGGSGTPGNNALTDCVFTLAGGGGGDLGLQRTCDEFGLDGYRVHKMVLPIQMSASAIGPKTGWCQYCHEIFVLEEPQPVSYNVG